MKSCQMYRFIPIMLLCVCLFTGGCSQNKDQPSATHNQTPATEAASHTDHTPQVLTPQADGTKTFTTDTAVIDISHTQEGYIMAKYTGFNAKPKLQLTGTDGITYTYSLYKDYSTFPLTSGDGTYQVGVYENVSDDRYTTLLSETFSVTLTDPLKPYLYPNQYVNFTADFLPVAKAEDPCALRVRHRNHPRGRPGGTRCHRGCTACPSRAAMSARADAALRHRS